MTTTQNPTSYPGGSACWCGTFPATFLVPVDPEVTPATHTMTDGSPAQAVCLAHVDRDGYEAVSAPAALARAQSPRAARDAALLEVMRVREARGTVAAQLHAAQLLDARRITTLDYIHLVRWTEGRQADLPELGQAQHDGHDLSRFGA